MGTGTTMQISLLVFTIVFWGTKPTPSSSVYCVQNSACTGGATHCKIRYDSGAWVVDGGTTEACTKNLPSTGKCESFAATTRCYVDAVSNSNPVVGPCSSCDWRRTATASCDGSVLCEGDQAKCDVTDAQKKLCIIKAGKKGAGAEKATCDTVCGSTVGGNCDGTTACTGTVPIICAFDYDDKSKKWLPKTVTDNSPGCIKKETKESKSCETGTKTCYILPADNNPAARSTDCEPCLTTNKPDDPAATGAAETSTGITSSLLIIPLFYI